MKLQVEIGNPHSASTLVHAIHNALTLLSPASTPGTAPRRVRIYCYAQDFDQLWNLNSANETSAPAAGDVLVVIRDGAQPDVADLPEAHKHLTALDWAVWYCLWRFDRAGGHAANLPTIVIVDGTSAAQAEELTDADRFFRLFAGRVIPAFPWIQTVHALPQLNQPCCLLQLLRCVTYKPGVTGHEAGVAMIRQFWQSLFLRPTISSDNHSLANILGAAFLTGKFNSSPTRQALSKLMSVLGLMPRQTDEHHVQIRSQSLVHRCNQLFTRLRQSSPRDLQFLLVDDGQKRNNWLAFVAHCLGLRAADSARSRTSSAASTNSVSGHIGKFPVHLAATAYAGQLLAKVRSAIDAKASLSWQSSHPLDVLLLDLRLFERAELCKEATFFLEVIATLRQLSAGPANHLGDWPRVSSSELRQAEAWCRTAIAGGENTSREDLQYIDVLTLLPRLVALVDPGLPIIMFSSTQRRRVAEILKPYGNIVTGFSKPALQLGQGTEHLQETITRLHEALLQAIDLVHARRVRQTLREGRFPVYWRGHVEKSAEERSTHPWHVQLLIDESGQLLPDRSGTKVGKLTLGGFLAIYPPRTSPQELSNAIYSAHPSLRRGKRSYRGKKLSDLIWNVVKLAGQRQILVIPMALHAKSSDAETVHWQWQGSDIFQDELVGDNLHREMIRCLTELALFVFARQILPAAAMVEFSLHAPTRVLPVKQEEAKALDHIWGVRSWVGRHGDLLAIHLESGSARPLLDEVLREYRGSSFEPIPVLARCFGLSDDAKDAEKQQVHALHYLVDGWLYDHKDAQLKEFNQLAIEGQYGPQLSRLLVAHRRLLRGNVAEAVGIGAEVALRLQRGQGSTALNSVLVSIQDAAAGMTGIESLALASYLKRARSTPGDIFVKGVVRSRRESDGSIDIEFADKLFHAQRRQCKSTFQVGDEVEFRPRRGNRVGTYIAHNVRRCHSEPASPSSDKDTSASASDETDPKK